jgi:hypothetical protein
MLTSAAQESRLTIKGSIEYISTVHIYPQLLVELTGYPDQYWSKSELTIRRFIMWYADRDTGKVLPGKAVTLDIDRYTYEIVGFR